MIEGDPLIERGSEIFKALAHPTRLFIVRQLGDERELCVRDITEMIGDDISTVSRHLAVLHQARIIDREKRGNQVYYRLAMPCVLHFLACVDNSTARP
jgi:DNA-binding transcriptional ArsR family regulator